MFLVPTTTKSPYDCNGNNDILHVVSYRYTAGSDSHDSIKRMPEPEPDQLQKRQTMVFRVQSRHVKFLLTF